MRFGYILDLEHKGLYAQEESTGGRKEQEESTGGRNEQVFVLSISVIGFKSWICSLTTLLTLVTRVLVGMVWSSPDLSRKCMPAMILSSRSVLISR